MFLKVEIYLVICAFHGVFGKSVQDVLGEYNPLLMKHLQLVESQIDKYDSQFQTFKANSSKNFSESVEKIVDNWIELETKATSAENKIDFTSEIVSDCFETISLAVDNISTHLDDCIPYENVVNIAKKLRILKHLPTKIADTVAECQKLYKSEEQFVELEGCLVSKVQEDETVFDSLTRSIGSNLDKSKTQSYICLKMAETSNLQDSMGAYIDLLSCLKRPKPDTEPDFNLEEKV